MDLESSQQALTTTEDRVEIEPDAIAARRFRLALRGYDRREVAEYLQDVASALHAAHAARDEALAIVARHAAGERIANERLAALEREAHRQAEREADLAAELAVERQADLAAELGLAPPSATESTDPGDELAELVASADAPDAGATAPQVEAAPHVDAVSSGDAAPVAPATPAAGPTAGADLGESFTRELADLVRATQERVASIESTAAAESAANRAAAERALAEAESRAAAMLQDAHRRVVDLGQEAEDTARRRADEIVAAAQHRVDHLRATEARLRQRIGTARSELADALAALDAPDDDQSATGDPSDPVADAAVSGAEARGVAPIDAPSPTVIDLSTPPSAPAAPVITWAAPSPEPGHGTATATMAKPAEAAVDGAHALDLTDPGAAGTLDEDDPSFDQLVRDALDRAVRQTRPSADA